MHITQQIKHDSRIKDGLPVTEIVTYICFHLFRTCIFATMYLVSHGMVAMDSEAAVIIGNNLVLGPLSSLFLLYATLHNLLTENTCGHCLVAGMVLRNFILSLVLMALECLELGGGVWLSRLGIILSYLLEFAVAVSFIRKRWPENHRVLFREVGADLEINRIFSIRKRLKILAPINLFTPTVIVQKLYLPPFEPEEPFEHIGWAIFCLTVLQQLSIYTGPDDENVVQKKIAIFITGLKALLTIVLLGFVVSRYMNIVERSRITRVVLYVDVLIVTLVLMYYLLMDTRSFGVGLKQRVEANSRRLTLQS